MDVTLYDTALGFIMACSALLLLRHWLRH